MWLRAGRLADNGVDFANHGPPSPWRVVPALGIAQILAWGSTYYLPAVLAAPIAADTGWPLAWVVGGLSIGLLIAGFVSPLVGRMIHRHGGKPVLAASALLMATGLLVIALAPNLAVFIAGWMFLGLGMSAGLYDAAFSTLGRTYGQAARRHITTLTLFGGFASTVCWPLSGIFLTSFGWRGACVAYAVIQIAVNLCLYFWVLPAEPRCPPKPDRDTPARAENDGLRVRPLTFGLLALTIALAAMVSSLISVHLLTILQAQDIALGAAVAMGALVGPSQVGARFVEMLIGRHHHPIWTKVAAASFVAIGLGLLLGGMAPLYLALIFYGAGIGLDSIARATLPLVLFGSDNYAPLMGRLARPSLFATAAAPLIGAMLILRFDEATTLGIVVALACLNVALVLLLIFATWRSTARP